MDTIFKGVLRYRHLNRRIMVKQLNKVKERPDPKVVFFACMDTRILPARFTGTEVGDMYEIRNAGNLVPHASLQSPDANSTEPAALELGCVVNDIGDVVVCGHSDCKAMHLLYALRDAGFASEENLRSSPLRAWMNRHAKTSLEKFNEFEKNEFPNDVPLIFQGEVPGKQFRAFIDPENRFSVIDKLSQINTLQQLENIASYPFVRKGLKRGHIHIHAIWFDITTGDVLYFSRGQKKFVVIDDEAKELLNDEIHASTLMRAVTKND